MSATNDGNTRSQTTLLLVDVQKDFHPGGSLAIPTADVDAERIASLIRRNGRRIDRIVATLDTHQKLHIAHPCFWLSGSDNQTHPTPFTIISAKDLENGIWKPRTDFTFPTDGSTVVDGTIFGSLEKVQDETTGKFDLSKYCIEYARRLEEKGRFKLCIWPEHCLIGSSGHGLVDCVAAAIHDWSETTGRSVEWVQKGQNLLTEMYSAMEADVPVSKATSFQNDLQISLQQSSRLIVCGQAMSHCVNYTLRDIVAHWPQERLSNIYLLEDCASAVPGFEAAADKFQEDMKMKGVQVVKASDIVI